MADLNDWMASAMESYVNHSLEPVQTTADFLRVKGIPRRDPFGAYTLDPLVRPRVLREGAELELKPVQILAMNDLVDMKGLFAPINVGGGKTLICWAAPSVLEMRGLYLTKANLVKEALRERKKYESLGLRVRPDTEIRSYSFVSQPKNSRWLEEFAPQIIMADEAHALRALTSARTKRFCRYLDAHPEVIFVCLSGTIAKRSLSDYGHLAHYALRQLDASFLPNKARETLVWAEAIDLDGPRRPPGVLREFCGSHENVRVGYRRRMIESPGVIATAETEVSCPLEIRPVDFPTDPEHDAAVSRMTSSWTRPDGEELVEAFEQARVVRQLKLGGFYYWDWPGEPDVEWLELRAEFRRALRVFLQHSSRPGLDSPALVVEALENNRAEVSRLAIAWHSWSRVSGRPEPPTRWRWVSLETVREIAKWALRRKAIVWTDVVAFGERLAQELGTCWYGANDDRISNENGHRTIVASIAAHGTGRNLQAFACNLICAGVPTGATVEQLLGRTHRPGQSADRVVTYYMKRFRDEMHTAVRDATYLEETLGNRQKLNLAMWPEGRP